MTRVTRLAQQQEGPLLVEGPVEVQLPDGTVVSSQRPVVALCTCRRTRLPPWCDTSHRRRTRDGAAGGDGDAACEADGDGG